MWRSKCSGLLNVRVSLLLLALVAHANIPDFVTVRAGYQPSDWVIADRDGQPLQTVRHDNKVRRLAWLSLDEISPTLRTTLVTAEDKRFWEHGGIDWAAVARAAWSNLRGRNVNIRGASTITMQLAGMLDPALIPRSGKRRDLEQKWNQALAARELEQHWNKSQIFEAYINLLPMRGEAIGVRAASQIWFGKAPDGLDWEEAALLAALVRQPQATPEMAAQRACTIIDSLDPASFGTSPKPECGSIKARALLALANKPVYADLPGPSYAPHIANDAITAWGTRSPPSSALPGGLPVIRTTLDWRIQRVAMDSLSTHLKALRTQNVDDGAAIVLDNASGEILAWVGSNITTSQAPEVDGVTAMRQAGSTLKPFLYALAFEQNRINAASLLDDSPIALTAANGAYIPQNYDRQFKGWVSARLALASSLNIPAVRTELLTGVDAFYSRLKTTGLTTLDKPADHYGFGLALGDADVRLIDLTDAYRMLANGGVWKPVAPILLSAKPARMDGARRVYSPEVAFIVADILSDRGARAPTFGLENDLSTRVWSAVKTGTSKDMRDNWCVGFTRHYTVGVWVGNFSGDSMWDVSGVHGAAPVWRDLIHALHESVPDIPPSPPRGVVASEVHFNGIDEAARREWFVRGTEVTEVNRTDLAESEHLPHITYPEEGIVVAIDPDIPLATERIVFQMEPFTPDYHWQLERQGKASCSLTLDAQADWPPQPGTWALQLKSADGQQVGDTVHFSVRGNARHPLTCSPDPPVQ